MIQPGSIVVKLGGSLMLSPQLPQWLEAVHRSGALLVPGGGMFADSVRRIQQKRRFADSAAHEMAIMAMCQFGVMCCSMMPQLKMFTSTAQAAAVTAEGKTPVWCGWPMAREWSGLASDWSVTADTLALMLAATIKARDLVVVKAAVTGSSRTVITPADELLDQAFAGQYRDYGKNIGLHCYGPDGYREYMSWACNKSKKKSGGLYKQLAPDLHHKKA